MTPARRARVYLWLAQLAAYELDTLNYAWPQPQGRGFMADDLLAARARCEARARAVLQVGGKVSVRAWKKFERSAWRDFTNPGAT